ncbi:uncharacterized protein BKA78DRAFT_299441 [Phyllosticta capitalensis]|uniref:uncharacterized protein n=1 Tax=Phyllosticta capitalensis TaxID=121624 RepID=UPI0031311705
MQGPMNQHQQQHQRSAPPLPTPTAPLSTLPVSRKLDLNLLWERRKQRIEQEGHMKLRKNRQLLDLTELRTPEYYALKAALRRESGLEMDRMLGRMERQQPHQRSSRAPPPRPPWPRFQSWPLAKLQLVNMFNTELLQIRKERLQTKRVISLLEEQEKSRGLASGEAMAELRRREQAFRGRIDELDSRMQMALNKYNHRRSKGPKL